MKCKHCKHKDECADDAFINGAEFSPEFDGQNGCAGFEAFTNADRIRAMSDEELAELFHGFCDNGERCVYCPLYEKSCAGVHSDVPKWLEWLQQPAEGECP
jgi:hypothetical protein